MPAIETYAERRSWQKAPGGLKSPMLCLPKESILLSCARTEVLVSASARRVYMFGIDFRHAVEFSRSGRAPNLGLAAVVLGQPPNLTYPPWPCQLPVSPGFWRVPGTPVGRPGFGLVVRLVILARLPLGIPCSGIRFSNLRKSRDNPGARSTPCRVARDTSDADARQAGRHRQCQPTSSTAASAAAKWRLPRRRTTQRPCSRSEAVTLWSTSVTRSLFR